MGMTVTEPFQRLRASRDIASRWKRLITEARITSGWSQMLLR